MGGFFVVRVEVMFPFLFMAYFRVYSSPSVNMFVFSSHAADKDFFLLTIVEDRMWYMRILQVRSMRR